MPDFIIRIFQSHLNNLNSASRARTSTTAAASSVENDLNLLNKANLAASKKTDTGTAANSMNLDDPKLTSSKHESDEAKSDTTSVTTLTAEQQAESDKEADAIRRRRLEHFQTTLNNQ